MICQLFTSLQETFQREKKTEFSIVLWIAIVFIFQSTRLRYKLHINRNLQSSCIFKIEKKKHAKINKKNQQTFIVPQIYYLDFISYTNTLLFA